MSVEEEEKVTQLAQGSEKGRDQLRVDHAHTYVQKPQEKCTHQTNRHKSFMCTGKTRGQFQMALPVHTTKWILAYKDTSMLSTNKQIRVSVRYI